MPLQLLRWGKYQFLFVLSTSEVHTFSFGLSEELRAGDPGADNCRDGLRGEQDILITAGSVFPPLELCAFLTWFTTIAPKTPFYRKENQ